jgi:hypothetical protein
MQARNFRYICGLTVLLTHIAAIICIALASRFTDFRDQIGSILIVAPVTLVYASSFLKYVVANAANSSKEAPFELLAAITMYLVVVVFCASLLFVVIRFAFLSSYQVNEFKMWLGAAETAFGALIGIVFDRLFGVQPAADGIPKAQTPDPQSVPASSSGSA